MQYLLGIICQVSWVKTLDANAIFRLLDEMWSLQMPTPKTDDGVWDDKSYTMLETQMREKEGRKISI